MSESTDLDDDDFPSVGRAHVDEGDAALAAERRELGDALTAEVIQIRAVDKQGDAEALATIDTSFCTDESFRIDEAGETLVLGRHKLPAPVRKSFPLDLDATDWEEGCVALLGETIVGFVAWRFESWNRRLVLWHLYVDVDHRRRGIGRQLIEQSIRRADELRAATVWIETSNLNVPGVRAYQGCGFTLCGFDRTLYRGTDSEGEFALFMARDVTEN